MPVSDRARAYPQARRRGVTCQAPGTLGGVDPASLRSAAQVGEYGLAPAVARWVEWQFGEDVAHVLAYRGLADEQLGRDRGVGEALRHQREHLLLPGCEPAEWT